MGSVTKVDSSTEIAKKLKARFKQKHDQLLEARKKRKEEKAKQRKDKKKGGDDGDPHVDPNAAMKGVLGKGDNYAARGYRYLKANDGRGVYRNFSHAHLDEIREMVRERAEFPEGPKENFNPSFTQQFPYSWQAHHMLPGEAFYAEADGKQVFTVEMIEMIEKSDYNINHGHNIIMLPSESWAVPVHALLQHKGDHPAYTMRVMSDMKVIARELQKKIDKKEAHENLVVDLFNELKRLEERYWKFLVKLSQVVVRSHTAGVRFVDDRVAYGKADDAAAYPWGKLT